MADQRENWEPQAAEPVQGPEEAITAALLAERQAQQALQEARAAADAMVDEAHRHARRIAERTADRIRQVHAYCAADKERRVEEILRHEGTAANNGLLVEQREEVLVAAVNRLAAELIGEEPR